MREAARASLLRWADGVKDLLEARRDDPDPEVRRTVREVLARAASSPGTPTPPAVDVSALGLVRMDARGPLEGVLRDLAPEAPCRYDLPTDAAAHDAEVHVDGAPYFQALEAVASSAGLEVPGPFDETGTVRLAAAEEDALPVPTSATGPLRARLVRVTASRAFGRSAASYVLDVSLEWRPDVEVVAYRDPTIHEATDSAGGTFRSSVGATQVLHAVAGPAAAASLRIGLEPEGPGTEERLAVLDVSVPVRLRHDLASVRFAGIDRLPRSVSAPRRADAAGEPNGTVTLQEVRAPEAAGAPWHVEVRARLPGETPAKSLRVLFEYADGSRAAAAVTAWNLASEGTLLWSGRASPSRPGAPAAVRVAWFEHEEDGEARFRWEDVPLR